MKKNPKNKLSLKSLFLKSLNLVAQQRKLIGIVFLIMFFAFLIGLIFPNLLEDEINALINSLVELVSDKSFYGITAFIIYNNLKSALFSIILGITIIFPLFSAVLNGYIIGVVTFQKAAESSAFVFLKILPHGIFEIPALCISIAFGLRIGLKLAAKIGGFFIRKKIKGLAKSIYEALMVYIFIIVPLLLIAGLIEGLLIAIFS